MRRIDHKAEAESHLVFPIASPANDPHGFALAHATLYLAEQQRVANKLLVTQIAQLGELSRLVAPDTYPRDPAIDPALGLTKAEWEALG